MTKEFTIEGVTYVANVDEAVKLGLLKKKVTKRPVCVKDVPNGTLFCWNSKHKECVFDGLFMMLDNKAFNQSQAKHIYNKNQKEISKTGWFGEQDALSYFDTKTHTWISEIEEG